MVNTPKHVAIHAGYDSEEWHSRRVLKSVYMSPRTHYPKATKRRFRRKRTFSACLRVAACKNIAFRENGLVYLVLG